MSTLVTPLGDLAAEYAAARAGVALFDVSARGKLELTGPEAPKFLHNLSTNDITGLPLGGGCELFFCTPKAKIIGHGRVYHLRLGDGRNALWLDLAEGTHERMFQHLDRHLIAEQVEIADRTADYAQIHLAGPGAAELLAKATDTPTPDLHEHMHMERTFGSGTVGHVRRYDPLGLPGYDIMVSTARAEGVVRMLLALGATAAGPETFDVLRIEAGTPRLGLDMDDNRFVVEVGRTAAISYSKGCYLGQEPIVMARDRAGHVNRLLLGVRWPEGAVAPGAKLYRDGTEMGLVTSVAQSPRLGSIGLAYVRRGHQDAGTAVEVESTDGSRQPATITALPM